jgi:uncharacterized DUF497 family protein
LAQAACVSIVLALQADCGAMTPRKARWPPVAKSQVTIPDPAHSQAEDRFIIIGRSHQQELLIVVHTEQGDNIRVISARRASRSERKRYEESN